MIRSVLFAPAIALVMSVAASAATFTLPGGTKAIDGKVGTGALAEPGRQVTVHYTGWLYQSGLRGTKFDSSRDRGQPFSFLLGSGEVILGWDEGVAGMRVGGTRTLIVPPAAGYGADSDGDIPPNSTLMFEVELLGVD